MTLIGVVLTSMFAALFAPRLVLEAIAEGSFVLYGTEGNRLRRFDLDTVGGPTLVQDVLIEAASVGEAGGPSMTGSFRDINGQICMFPDGSGRFVAGEDTGQPSPLAGWGVFSPDGKQIGKLTATYFVPGAEPHGCAFGQNGILFTSEVGEQGFGTPNGQLIMWFPPYDNFPGPPGAYPETVASSTNFCKLATDIGTAGGVAVDKQGRVYVASSSLLSVYRFSPPFPTGPDAAGGCGSQDGLGSPMADVVHRETIIGPAGISTWAGLAIAPNGDVYASSVLTGQIFEYNPDGQFVRMILDPADLTLPIPTGAPQDLTVGPDGTLFYADLNLVGTLPNIGPGPNGKVWRIRFDGSGDPLPPEVIRENLAFPDGLAVFPGDLEPTEWRTYAGGPSRQFFNADTAGLGPDNVAQLSVKWAFATNAIVTASPSVARVDVPDEGRIPVAYVQSWDGNVYAVRVRDGSELWRFTTDPQPVAYPNVGSAHVETVDGRDIVYIANGETLYALDAVTGEEIWRFQAGTGCVDPPGLCGFAGERNEIESSAIVADGKVFFGMDVEDMGGKGGFYGVEATDGRLAWFFDLETGSTCRPDPDDNIRRFDGYHAEAELGLPPGFLSTRAGCDFARTRDGCGNVWSSAALDTTRGLLFVASANCDTDNDPGTPAPPPPMPPYDEAIFALDLDGTPVWRWRPREVEPGDLEFGAVPNLFTAEIGGEMRDVVGVGNKDGTYYLLDRDGENELTGVRWDDPDPSGLPYWTTNVVAGGDAGGIIATAAIDEHSGRVYFGTAPGSDNDVFTPQRPTMHALDARTGAILWENDTEVNADATFAPTSAVPGVVFTGSVVGGFLRGYDATNGERRSATPVGVALASAPAVIDGLVLVGGGIGTRTGNPADPAEISSWVPHDLTALCVPGTPACRIDQPIAGKKLRVVDDESKPGKKRMTVLSRDATVTPPSAGSGGDPTITGAVLHVLNPSTGEGQIISLPASSWIGRGNPPGTKGYRYRDRKREKGPCRRLLLRQGYLAARCVGEGIAITLDEAQQGALAVALDLGNATTYCMRFGGTVGRDVSTAGSGYGTFAARNAAAPVACPLP